MGNTFFIVWRESLEAMLVIGILYSTLSSGEEFKKALRFMWAGVAAGVLSSIILAIVTVVVQDELSGRALEFFQSGILIAAALLMTQMVMWMNRHGRRMKKKIESDLHVALNSSSHWGVAFVAAAAIAREGTETAVYLYGMSLESAGAGVSGLGPVAGGSIAGLVVAAATAWLVSRGIRFLNYQLVFKVTGIALLISAGGLLVNGVNRLIELDLVPALVNPVWNSSGLLDGGKGLGKFLSSFAGYQARPSLMIVLIYLAYWLGTWAWIRLRRTTPSPVTA